MRGRLREYIQANAHQLSGGNIESLQRFEDAAVSRVWMWYNMKKYHAGLGMSGSAKKTQKKLLNRAKAKSATLSKDMFDKIERMYKKHHEQGLLKCPSARPAANQVVNGDEVGFDPTGRWGSVFSFKWDRLNSTLGTAERAPFWVSMFFFSRGDGLYVIPPCLIHQGVQGELSEYNMLTHG